MELEEAKKVLMSLPQYQERGNEEYEAIDTVISELVALQDLVDEQREEIEELQKEHELYKDKIVLLSDEEYRKVIDTAQKDCISKDKIKEKIEEQTARVNKVLEELVKDKVDKSTGCIILSYLSKKEREEIINKRNCLLVQRATLQQVKEELLKGE